MCVVSKPKIPDPSTDPSQNKPLPILRNPILDGMLGNIAALRAGTSAFRIDLINPLTIGGARPGRASFSSGGGSSSGGSSGSSSSSGSSGSGFSSSGMGGSPALNGAVRP